MFIVISWPGAIKNPRQMGWLPLSAWGLKSDAGYPKTGFLYIQSAWNFILREIREMDAYILRHEPRDSGDISRGHIRVA